MKATCLIRRGPEYRHEAFHAGLKACGYTVGETFHGGTPGRDDVLVIWNRYGSGEAAAAIFEKAGAHVLVAENGYIGRDGQGIQYYALARNGHNGSGAWLVGPDNRSARLGLALKPLREATPAGHILVCAQRGIGPALMASPHGWHESMAARLRPLTGREIRIRRHPGERHIAPPPPLEQDLAGAHAVVVWSSGAGIRALVEGIPVFYDAPCWVAAPGATPAAALTRELLETPPFDEALRIQALHRLSWAQWSLEEIASGRPFVGLLGEDQPNCRWVYGAAVKRAA